MRYLFSFLELILLPLLIIATIICGYFALPTTRTIAVTKSVEQIRSGYVTKNIEDIQIGDEVFAYDVTTGKVEKCKVTDTFERTSDHLRYLTVCDSKGTQIFETTDSHPFWVVTDKPDLSRTARETVNENDVILQHENITPKEHGYYVEAKDLKVGDTFIGASNEVSVLVATQRKDFPEGITVYNFTVEDNHNYFVIANLEAFQNGANVVLVHNAKYSKDQQTLQRIVRETTNDGHKPLTVSQAETILDWAKEIDYPNIRASIGDVTGQHWGVGEHIHIPGVGNNHIRVEPGVRPR